MFDIKQIRENPGAFDAGMEARGLGPQSGAVLALDRAWRAARAEAQAAQTERNRLSEDIGKLFAAGEKDKAEALKQKAAASKTAEAAAIEAERRAEAALNETLAGLPNVPADGVPAGADESANVEIRRWGDAPKFDFEAKDHVDTGAGLDGMDFETAAKMAGARFVMLTGPLARLERALAQFMLDVHTRANGYTEVSPPLLVNDAALYGTGQLPKFSADLFRAGEGRWLIPTAEAPLTNIAAGHVIDEDYLPRRYTALTPCFRSEAGAAGKDTRGMLRQHQFMKVEMVSVTHPDESGAELERMTGCAENILQSLGLPHRTVVLSSGDMGFSARKTYDIEVWLPGQNAYREISSCSDCGDFQARRMNARFRRRGEKGGRFVHTLNGSGLAVGRALIAVLENFQNADGSVDLPECLRPYMGGLARLTPPEKG